MVLAIRRDNILPPYTGLDLSLRDGMELTPSTSLSTTMLHCSPFDFFISSLILGRSKKNEPGMTNKAASLPLNNSWTTDAMNPSIEHIE
jgi:hypothetical protein